MSVLLVLTIVLGQGSFASVAYADGLSNDDEDNSGYEISGGDEYLKQIRGYRSEIEKFEPANESEKEIVDKFLKDSKELEEAIETLNNPEAVGGPEAAAIIAKILELYPLHTIPKRVELLAQTVEIINFAKTELREKPVSVQREVAAFAIKGIGIALMPGEIKDAADEQLAALSEMKEYWLSADDATMDDLANIYHRHELDVKLSEARRIARRQLADSPSYVADELRAEIRRITNERLKIGNTKGRIWELKSELNLAVTKALSNNDQVASNADVRVLKSLYKEAKKAAKAAWKAGDTDRYQVLSGLVDEASKELKIGNYRKSKTNVDGLISSLNFELGH